MTQVGDGLPLPGRRKRGHKTREEYLATSLSRLKPWEAEGISRRTYYRRLKQFSDGGTSPPRGTNPRGTSLSGTSPRGTSPRGTSLSGASAARGTSLPGTSATPRPTRAPKAERVVRTANQQKGAGDARWGGRPPVWADAPGRTLLRLLRSGRREIGEDAKFEDLIEQIRPRLPESIRKSAKGALYAGQRKARESLPSGYDRWVSLTQLWGGRRWDEEPEGPFELVDELITIAGKNAHRLGELFDRWNRQYADGGAKFRRLLKFSDRIKADPLDWPRRPRPATYSDANAAAVRALMQDDPKRFWSVSQLANSKVARKRGISTKAMTHLTKTMRDRGELEWSDFGRSLLRLSGCGLPIRKSCSQQMIIKLIAAPDHAIEIYALIESVGAPAVTAVETLRRNGVVECPDFRRGTLVKLAPEALAKIERNQPIRDGRGAILWVRS